MNILNQLVNTHATIDKALQLCDDFLIAQRKLLLQEKSTEKNKEIPSDYLIGNNKEDIEKINSYEIIIKRAKDFHNSEKQKFADFNELANVLYNESQFMLEVDYQCCRTLIEKIIYMWFKNEFPVEFNRYRKLVPQDNEDDGFPEQKRESILDSYARECTSISWKDFGNFIRSIEEQTEIVKKRRGYRSNPLKRRMANVPAWLFLRYIPRNR